MPRPLLPARTANPLPGHSGAALGLLEVCSLARGMAMLDAMIKKAPVTVERGMSVHPGKYLAVISGGVDEVDEALGAGRQVADETLVDSLFLPLPHEALLARLRAPGEHPLQSLGILETYAVAAALRGADAALKAAEVYALRLNLANDLGGKGCFVFTGALHDVQAAMSAARPAAGEGLLAGCEIIANPAPELLSALD